jgi:hypothetical protein
MSAELEVLQDALARLERADIATMLTGSLALSYYAEPRMTRDIDLVVECAGRDPERIAALFAPDYYVSGADVARALADRGMFNVLHLEKLVKVDLIVRKEARFRVHEFERRVRVRLADFEAWIATREDLICENASMNDTTPEFRKLVEARLLALAPAERVTMCADMFETARALVEASLPTGLDPRERRRRICRRFYGDLADKAFPAV